MSEYVRGLLREAQTKQANTRLEALLLQGLASGDARVLHGKRDIDPSLKEDYDAH